MDLAIEEMIKEIQNSMCDDFETRSVVIKNFKKILEDRLDRNPNDVKVASVLAMLYCELRESSTVGFKILETLYFSYKETLTNDDFEILATNMAYFIHIEEEFSTVKAEDLLLEVIHRGAKYPNAYFGLGSLYFGRGDYNKASNMFSMAFGISGENKYKYSEAICLIMAKELQSGVKALKSIYSEVLTADVAVKTAVSLALVLAELGDFKESHMILNKIKKCQSAYEEILYKDLSDLLFMNGEYDECVKLYDEIQYGPRANWLGEYFYSLKQIGKEDIAKNRLNEVIKAFELDIQMQSGNLSVWDSQNELDEYIKSEEEELRNIKKCFDDVFVKNILTKAMPEYYIIDGCYYLYCPRHY